MIAGRLNSDPVDLAFVGLVIVGCAFILWLGRSSTFRLDDWVIASEQPPPSLDYLLVPHNEHWSAFMKLPFQLLFGVVGLHSYLPYLALLVAAHGAATVAVYAVISAAAGRVLAFAVGSVLLLLGTAHETLFWYASIGYLLSLATGATATWLLLARPASPRLVIAVFVLLVFSVMSSGCGLAFVAGLAIALLLDPTRRAAAWGPIGAGLVYFAWYLIWGHSAVAGVSLDSVIGIGGFVFVGASNAFAAATGLGRGIGGIAVVVLVGAVWVGLVVGRRPSFAAIASSAGLVAFLGITALVRVDAGPSGSEMAAAPRYIAISAPLIAIALAGLLGRPTDRSAARLRAVVVAPLLVLALVSNGFALVDAAPRYATDATAVRAAFRIWDRDRAAPAVRDSERLPLGGDRLDAMLAAYGSPVTDTIRPSVVLPITADALDRALFVIVRDDLIVVPDIGAVGADRTQPPADVGAFEMEVRSETGCLHLVPSGPGGLVWLTVPFPDSLRFATEGWGDVHVFVARDAPFQDAASISQPILARQRYRIALPDMGPGSTWRVAVKFGPGIRSANLCVLSAAT